MLTKEYHVIGVMSGTSLDGLDIVYVTLKFDLNWSFNIIHAVTIPYSDDWLLKLSQLSNLGMKELQVIDLEYSKYVSETIAEFIDKHQIKTVDLVASHGHTAKHLPHKNFTYQIGNLQEIASSLNHTVICDFRVQDVELGGQGAPLVPIGDQLLFSEFDYCINLGGFSNISFEKDGFRIAYDICPVNTVLNTLSQRLNLDYDVDGKLAKSGNLNPDLLNALNQLAYYHEDYPKSLGIEWVQEHIWPILNQYNISTQDLLRTFVEHIAIQIALNTQQINKAKLLFTGGGTLNFFLMERVSFFVSGSITIPDALIINYKEALIFSLLGVLKLRGEINCLKSVTGAKHDHSSGRIHTPNFN